MSWNLSLDAAAAAAAKKLTHGAFSMPGYNS